MITTRFIVGIPVAAAITFGLFVLMRSLIASEGGVERVVYQEPSVIIIGRKVEETPTKEIEPYKEPTTEVEPPTNPPPVPPTGGEEGELMEGEGYGPVVVVVGESIDGVCGQPTVRIAPTYPRKAAELGIEGYAVVEFTVTTQGTVKDAVVVEQEPGTYFGTSAVRAVKKWRYQPCKINGKVQEVRLQVRLVFELDDES